MAVHVILRLHVRRREGDDVLVFDLITTRKVVRRDTAEYTACCHSHDCGYGYISTLVYGQGEYASGRETRVQGEADYVGLVSGAGHVNVKASERKKVKGWVMAVVTPHEVVYNMDPTRSTAFIASGATGIGLGLGGFGMMAYGLVRGPKLEDQFNREPENRDQIKQKITTANDLAIAGGVLGGLFAAAGVALLIVGIHGRKRKRFALTPLPGGAMITGRF